jgi:glycosyltransferase involved in cell wall biosynthesis
MRLAIVIPTYYRRDGATSVYLNRAISSVFKQTHQDFKIYLIGDRYEKENEINELLSRYDGERIHYVNLIIAKERDNYTDKLAIWSYGGVNAVNTGIEISLLENNFYICHLDHDDYWLENHLEEIANCIKLTGSDWICTKSFYGANIVLPRIEGPQKYISFLPKAESLIHSSVCMNFKKIPLRYRDIYCETGAVGLPADADLWERSRAVIETNNLKSTLINLLTCAHAEEGFERDK